jgi:hypothetical protein
MCLVNEEAISSDDAAMMGKGRFCVVAGSGTQCSYGDAEVCRRAAAMFGGTCIVKPSR